MSNFYIILALIKLLGVLLEGNHLLFLDSKLSKAQYEFHTRAQEVRGNYWLLRELKCA